MTSDPRAAREDVDEIGYNMLPQLHLSTIAAYSHLCLTDKGENRNLVSKCTHNTHTHTHTHIEKCVLFDQNRV